MPPPIDGMLEAASAKVRQALASAKMTPANADMLIAHVGVLVLFCVCFAAAVVAVKVVRAVTAAVFGSGGAKGEASTVGQVAASAWMSAAGITHPSQAEDTDDDPSTPSKMSSADAPDTPGAEPAEPFSPGRSTGFYQNLTTREHECLRLLRGELNKANIVDTPALERFCTDATLCRYLRARKWSVRKAMKMLKASIAWRKKTKPDEITWDDVAAEGATGKQYVPGKDNSGKSLLVMRPGRENTKEHAGNIRFLIYTLEHALWCEDPENQPPLGAQVKHDAEKLVILINFTGWSLSTAPPMRTSRETLSILQDHYPERLAVAVCYNPPWIFAVFWKAISPFIDPTTYRKIRFVNPKREKEVKRMKQMFDMRVIDADMGGHRDPTFDAKEYGRLMREYDKMKTKTVR